MRSRNEKAFSERFRRFCKENHFYEDGGKTLVGLSGGADSVCLLCALSSLLGKDRLVAVHINHMLRGEDADKDEAFCRSICEERGIPFIARHVDVYSLCGGSGIEDTARNVRYQVFSEEAKASGCSSVSLAHTAGDNLETMLFHLCRGGGLSGLSGIPASRMADGVRIVRPLLPFTREDILAYLAASGIPHREDRTNADTRYTRNFIRHEIVPRLKTVNPQAEENAASAAAILSDAMEYLSAEAKRVCLENGIVSEADTALLLSLPKALRYEVLSTMARSVGVEFLFSKQAEAITALLTENKKGKHAVLSDGVVASVDGAKLRFRSCADFLREKEKSAFTLPLHMGENKMPDGNIIFLGAMPPEALSERASFFAHTKLNSESPLFARERRDGERYRTGSMTRTLKKQLCGASERVKRCRPVICDGDGILWFPSLGVRDGKRGQTDIYYLEF